MTSHSSTAAPLLAMLLLVVGAYVGGYFVVEDYWEMGNVNCTVRTYRHQWQATIFQGAAWVESKLTGVTVETRALRNKEGFP
jgi:hypothetical protein